ncbi:MAG: hypothetical protein GF349_01965 [Candidatus Magasanikbacteria bacterium]|nr:hypothetical protein [Candidatus Magasanikbacteria bacterium]
MPVNKCNLFFIVGSYRSGTTLLRNILNLHEDVAVVPEMHFFDNLIANRKKYGDIKKRKNKVELVDNIFFKIKNFNISRGDYWENINLDHKLLKSKMLDCTDLRELFFVLASSLSSKNSFSVLIEKTPYNVFFLEQITELFPEAGIIHIIRDGREVCASACKRWGLDYLGPATRWKDSIKSYEKYNKKNKDKKEKFIEIRYEDLVDEPKNTINKIFKFINLGLNESFFERMSDLPSTSSFTRYKKNFGLYKSNNFKKFFSDSEQDIINYLLYEELKKKNIRPKQPRFIFLKR